MKYRIAIVDDERKDIDNLINIFSELKDEQKFNYEISTFLSANQFLDKFSKSSYDVVFTDMYMPEIDGISMCKKLRKIDDQILIILTTNFAKYALDGYSINAFDFILKPASTDSVKRVIKRFLEKDAQYESKIISTKIGSIHYRFDVNDIYYIESYGHTLKWVTKNGNYEGTGSLGKLEKTLPAERFVRCSNSFIVNLNLITSLKGKEIKINDNLIHVTKTYEKTFMSRFADALKSL